MSVIPPPQQLGANNNAPQSPLPNGALGQQQQRPTDKMEPGPTVVFIGGIPSASQNPDELVQFLGERFGQVEAFKLVVDTSTGKHKGYGFVKFATNEVAENARRLRNVEFKGKVMNLGSAFSGGGQQRRTSQRPGGPMGAMGGASGYGYAPSMYSPQGTPAYNGRPGSAPGLTPEDGVCRYWLRNACRKGRQCPFKHPGPMTGGAGGPAGPDGYQDYYAQMWYWNQYQQGAAGQPPTSGSPPGPTGAPQGWNGAGGWNGAPYGSGAGGI